MCFGVFFSGHPILRNCLRYSEIGAAVQNFQKFFQKNLQRKKIFVPLQSRLTKTGFFNEIIENTERLKVQASTEKL